MRVNQTFVDVPAMCSATGVHRPSQIAGTTVTEIDIGPPTRHPHPYHLQALMKTELEKNKENADVSEILTFYSCISSIRISRGKVFWYNHERFHL